jgi:hypothetical protein
MFYLLPATNFLRFRFSLSIKPVIFVPLSLLRLHLTQTAETAGIKLKPISDK